MNISCASTIPFTEMIDKKESETLKAARQGLLNCSVFLGSPISYCIRGSLGYHLPETREFGSLEPAYSLLTPGGQVGHRDPGDILLPALQVHSSTLGHSPHIPPLNCVNLFESDLLILSINWVIRLTHKKQQAKWTLLDSYLILLMCWRCYQHCWSVVPVLCKVWCRGWDIISNLVIIMRDVWDSHCSSH